MKNIVLAVLLATSLSAAADSYKIDSSHTSIVFKISHLGYSYVYGMLPGAEGKFTIDDAKPEKSSVEISVKSNDLETFDKKRNDHLKGPDFFNAKQFGTITFKSKSVKKLDGNKYEVAGDLTLHGQTKPQTFTFVKLGSGKDPWGNTRFGGETNFTVKRSAFGMTFMNGPGQVGDDVELMISLEGIKI